MSFASVSRLIINGIEVTVHNCDGCSKFTPLPNHYCDECKANGRAEKDMASRIDYARRVEEARERDRIEHEKNKKTVRQLIEELSAMPPDAEVLVSGECGDGIPVLEAMEGVVYVNAS